MASNLVVARGGVEFVPPISLAFWRWTVVFLLLLPFTYLSLRKNLYVIKKEYKKFPAEIFYKGLSPEEIVGSSMDDFFGNELGYFTFFSEFTSFDILSMIKGSKASLALEHCF